MSDERKGNMMHECSSEYEHEAVYCLNQASVAPNRRQRELWLMEAQVWATLANAAANTEKDTRVVSG